MNDKILSAVADASEVQRDDDQRAPAFSELALALSFVDQHAKDLRYVAAWNKWLSWDGQRWYPDTILRAFDLAHALCRKAAVENNKERGAKDLARAKTVAAVITLARADRRLAATADQWDADPWLLNTPGGVVDLRTGECRPARSEDYMTKITAVAPDRACPCPLWEDAFLKDIVPDELAKYLRRAFGYSLTGSIREQVLFFLYGMGKNGKSVFVGTIAGIMGDYHVTAPIETFMATDNPQHPTELARLQGARLVSAVETEEGRRWAQSRVNMVTGGDKISARFMRQDFFEYVPQFKLAIYGNYRPALRSINEAIRRRMNLLPFEKTIAEDRRDKDLAEKLKGEWPGILQWLIDGCLEWQRDGLMPPKIVTESTEEYLNAEDSLVAWLDDCCIKEGGEWIKSADLFEKWRTWAEKAGEYVGSQKRFSDRLQAHGFRPERKHEGRGFWPPPSKEPKFPFLTVTHVTLSPHIDVPRARALITLLRGTCVTCVTGVSGADVRPDRALAGPLERPVIHERGAQARQFRLGWIGRTPPPPAVP